MNWICAGGSLIGVFVLMLPLKMVFPPYDVTTWMFFLVTGGLQLLLLASVILPFTRRHKPAAVVIGTAAGVQALVLVATAVLKSFPPWLMAIPALAWTAFLVWFARRLWRRTGDTGGATFNPAAVAKWVTAFFCLCTFIMMVMASIVGDIEPAQTWSMRLYRLHLWLVVAMLGASIPALFTARRRLAAGLVIVPNALLMVAVSRVFYRLLSASEEVQASIGGASMAVIMLAVRGFCVAYGLWLWRDSAKEPVAETPS